MLTTAHRLRSAAVVGRRVAVELIETGDSAAFTLVVLLATVATTVIVTALLALIVPMVQMPVAET